MAISWTLFPLRTFAFGVSLTLLASPLIAPLAHAEWYTGGTLHKADGHAWVKASEKNRLATASDFAVIVIGQNKVARELDSFDDFRPYAGEMKACIDGMYNSAEERRPVMRAKSTASIAALCASGVEGLWRRNGH